MHGYFLEDILESTGYQLTAENQIDDYGQERTWKSNKQFVKKRKSQIASAVEVNHLLIANRLVCSCSRLLTVNAIFEKKNENRTHSYLLTIGATVNRHANLCCVGIPIA